MNRAVIKPTDDERALLAQLHGSLTQRGQIRRELLAVDVLIAAELRKLASLRGVGFIRVESIRKELGL